LNFTNVTLIVRKGDTQNHKIEEIVSKICRCKMSLTKIETSKRAGWNVLSLKTAPKFAMAFGTASIKKDTSSVSGDAYSIIKLAHDKFLLALCDGMGSGKNAQKTASTAISLVENFYKAGFDNEIILSSVNKLLSLNSTDNFTALDICVLDMQNGTLDFVKMGAPESFIKHTNTTTKILGGTLPLGIVQDAQPIVIKQIISNGDFVFMFTDGITESFETEEMLEDFINNLTSLNPQTLADEVIKKAHTLSGGARDDMTVLVAKIFSLK
jgi:stage II sporulation protein E